MIKRYNHYIANYNRYGAELNEQCIVSKVYVDAKEFNKLKRKKGVDELQEAYEYSRNQVADCFGVYSRGYFAPQTSTQRYKRASKGLIEIKFIYYVKLKDIKAHQSMRTAKLFVIGS